ncbi:MAG: ROK family protein [Akkermansia sp.]
MNINAQFTPVLDPNFVAPVLWNKAYQAKVAATPGSGTIDIALTRLDGTCFRWSSAILPHEGENVALNKLYVERTVKFLLWMKGGCTIMVAGCDAIADMLADTYTKGGAREFDWDFIGTRIYDQAITVEKVACACELPAECNSSMPLGRNLDGYRIGFDLGGSDRKCAAVVNGEVVFSEEVVWDPYHQKDPNYQLEGVDDSLIRAAKHIPQVDAIGGSAAGVYVNSQPRVGSLFRGISNDDFDQVIRPMFTTLKDRWSERMGKEVPFEVVNDGEVTALAGAMGMEDDAVLGVAMGTSLASGYVDGEGHIMPWLNELAFVPVDYQEDGGVDEWSGDKGCGALYFSQQAVNRLAPRAGFEFGDMPYPEQLKKLQAAMEANDDRARKIYETIGVQFGYTVAYFAEFYDVRNLLFLGRVATGEGGQIIIDKASEVLAAEFPSVNINLCVPDEKTKRHGQAVAAASLPKLG